MLEFFRKIFESRFLPHGHCFLWTPDILWMSVISDALIAASYYVIPLGLIYLVRRRNDLAFSWIFYLFGLFIVSCGATHIMGIVTLWHPVYRLEAVIKALTAVASVPAAIALVQMLPKAVGLTGPGQLRAANESLRGEVLVRQRAEQEVRRLNSELERRVQERTAELRETSERLKAITEASPLAIWACDLDGNVTFWNPAAERLYEWTRDEVLGQPVPHVAPENREHFLQELAELLTRGPLVDAEATRSAKSGRQVNVSFSVAALRPAGGETTGYLAVVSDITRRKQAEDALRESEARFRTMADSIPQLAWMANADGNLFWYNQRWYEFSGTTFEEMQGWGWRQIHHPDHIEGVIARWTANLRTGEPWEDTFPLRSRTGEWRSFLSRARPIRDAQGNVVRWFGTNTDITEQLRTEQALRTSEERFRQLADAMPQIVWVTRPDGFHEYFNRRWYEYTGLDIENETSEAWTSVIHPDDRGQASNNWQHSLKTGEPYHVEFRARRHDAEYRWFLALALPGYGDDGAIQRWYGTCTDIHDQKRIEEELRRANADLQQFAYAASHDLQEPLRNMALFSQLLQREHSSKLDGEAAQFLRYIVEGAQRMHALLQDVLAYSRLSSPPNPRLEHTDANAAFVESLMNLAATIEESQATVTASQLPSVVILKSHLVQLLQNLIGNAIKYRDHAPPVVHVSARRGNAAWIFAVQDNGIGIDPRYHSQIFGLFKRLHKDQFSGTGIGLAICQKIVERYNGRIWVDSQTGHGSTFYFSLPD